jgi:hypothetical protein
MDALDVVLVGMVALLATALAMMLFARLRDIRTVHEHREELDLWRTDEISKRERLEAELHAARARIGELELGQFKGQRQPELAGRFSRR